METINYRFLPQFPNNLFQYFLTATNKMIKIITIIVLEMMHVLIIRKKNTCIIFLLQYIHVIHKFSQS